MNALLMVSLLSYVVTYPMSSSVQQQIKDNGVKYIRFQFTDIYGSLRGLEIPVARLESFLADGLGIDGSSVGFMRAEGSDLRIMPDPTTFQALPWEPKIATITCDLTNEDGSPFDADPRTILKKQLEKVEQKGWIPEVRPELEYYLVKEGKPAENTGYMMLPPFDRFSELRRQVVDYCIDVGMAVKYAHTEVGPGQQEIELSFQDPLLSADHIVTMKQIVRWTAINAGLEATFLPKPFAGEAGNGLHVHQRLLDKEGNSIFGNEKDFTDEGRHYVGGLLQHAPGATVFYNPITNSYRRMVPGHEAPVYLSWGIGNRTALVRVPGLEKSIRVEFRSADGAANIYLIIALQIAAGLDGIANKTEPPEPTSADVTTMSREERLKRGIGQLPDSLWTAMEEVKKDKLVQEVVGQNLLNIFLTTKAAEWDYYITGPSSVTQCEFNKFFDVA